MADPAHATPETAADRRVNEQEVPNYALPQYPCEICRWYKLISKATYMGLAKNGRVYRICAACAHSPLCAWRATMQGTNLEAGQAYLPALAERS